MKKEVSSVLRDIELVIGPASGEKGGGQGPASARPGATEGRGNTLQRREQSDGPTGRGASARRSAGPQLYEGEAPQSRRPERPTAGLQRQDGETPGSTRERGSVPAQRRERTEEPRTPATIDPGTVLAEFQQTSERLDEWRTAQAEQKARRAAQLREAEQHRAGISREAVDEQHRLANDARPPGWKWGATGATLVYLKHLRAENVTDGDDVSTAEPNMQPESRTVPEGEPITDPFMSALYTRLGIAEGSNPQIVQRRARELWADSTKIEDRAAIAELLLGRRIDGMEITELPPEFRVAMHYGGGFAEFTDALDAVREYDRKKETDETHP